jgi:hypothetical protein
LLFLKHYILEQHFHLFVALLDHGWSIRQCRRLIFRELTL